MENSNARICPICKTEITEFDAAKVCPACGVAHHAACWEKNQGCAIPGCPEQPQAAQPVAEPVAQPVAEPAAQPVAEPVAQPVAEPVAQPVMQPVTPPVMQPAAQPAAANVCPNCGTPVAENQAFCPMCGAAKPAAPKKTFCNKCGNELKEGQTFCQQCGQQVGLTVAPAVNSAINQFNANIQNEQAKAEKKKLLLIPIILGVVAVIAVVLFLLLKGPSVDDIELSESSIELSVGDTYSVSYKIEPDDASDVDVTWKSSDTSVATVSSSGKITAKGDGTCTITASAGGESDKVTVTVTSGPDFEDLYFQYCNYIWAEYGSDGSYLYIDTNPYDVDDKGVAYIDAYYAVENVNNALGLPSSVFKAMGETTGNDGKQTEVYGNITITWKYHPDKGLEVTYSKN